MFNLDLGNLIAHLDMNTSRWDKALDKVQLKMKYTAAKLDSIGKSMTLKVTTPILAIGAASLKTATSLETAFIGVRKTVNATEKEFKDLTEIARKMGATTEYTATQAAEGLKFLAMAGLGAEKSVFIKLFSPDAQLGP